MWNYNYSYELYHHGVKGMRWGVRKARIAERVAIRRAAGAITDKRKEAFLKKANEYNERAKTLESKSLVGNNKFRKPSWMVVKDESQPKPKKPSWMKGADEDGLTVKPKIPATAKTTKTVNKGRNATKGVLLGIGGVTVGVAAAAAIGFRKTLKDMNINPKEFMETAQTVYAASKKK